MRSRLFSLLVMRVSVRLSLRPVYALARRRVRHMCASPSTVRPVHACLLSVARRVCSLARRLNPVVVVSCRSLHCHGQTASGYLHQGALERDWLVSQPERHVRVSEGAH